MAETSAAAAKIVIEPKLRRLFEYWQVQRAGQRCPTRRDIDPAAMPRDLLSHLMLLEFDRAGDGFNIVIRLTGTHIDAAFGRNPTGEAVSEKLYSNKAYAAYLQDLYRDLADTGRPIYSENYFRLAGQGMPMIVKRLSLPLSRDGTAVDMALVGVVFEYPLYLEPRYSQTLETFGERTRMYLDG